MSIGETLKKAREDKGLTDMEVAEATHMMVQMVREIEADDFHRFAAPIYGKGFIKLFAKAVGLDPVPLVSQFIAEQKQPPRAPGARTPAPPPPPPEPQKPATARPPGPTEDRPDPPPPAAHPGYPSLKASSVTLPNADSPFSPANIPPPRQPVSPPARRPPTEADNAFTLEADTVASGLPPQPVDKPREPFKYPAPARRPAPTAPADTDRAPEEAPAPKPRKHQRPPGAQSRNTPSRLTLLAHTARHAVRHGAQFLAAQRAALADRWHAQDEDDADANIRRRYVITGALVCLAVLGIIIIAASGSGSDPHTADPANGHPPPAPPIATGAPEPLPDGPVEIVRVLPAPKLFAR